MVQPWTCLWFAEMLKANINIIITFKRLTNPIDKISRPFDTDTLRCDHTVESTHVSTPLQRGSAMRQQAWGLISQPCGEPLLLSPRRFHSRSCGVLLLCLVLAVHSGLAVTVTWHALVGSRNLTSTWQEGRDCLCNTHSLRLAPLDPRSPSQPRSYNLLISFWHLSPSLSFTGQVVSWRPVIFLPPPRCHACLSSHSHAFLWCKILYMCLWGYSTVHELSFFPPRFPGAATGLFPFWVSTSRPSSPSFVPSITSPPCLPLPPLFWHAMFLHCTSVTCDLVTHSPGFTPTWLRRQSPCSTYTEETVAMSGKQRQSTISSGRMLWWKSPLTTVLKKKKKKKSSWDHDFRFCVGYL